MDIERRTESPPSYEIVELQPLTGGRHPEGNAATVQHASLNRAPIRASNLEVGLANAAMLVSAAGTYAITYAFTHADTDRVGLLSYGAFGLLTGVVLAGGAYALAETRSQTRQNSPA